MSDVIMQPPTRRRKKKYWSYSAGEYHFRVRVYETESGTIHAEMKDPTNKCGYRAVSLRHADKAPFTREEAVAWARQQSAEWMACGQLERSSTPTLARVFALYKQHVTPGKALRHQWDDTRRAEMWTRYLGPQKDLSKITLREWQEFIPLRRTGAINARGERVPIGQRLTVSDGSIWSDFVFLNAVLNWATKWKVSEEAGYLMKENPCRGYPMVKEKNPKRPVTTPERYEKIRAVAERVKMVGPGCAFRRNETSYLREVLDLVWHTGRRISSVLALRYSDLILDAQPWGAIRWPAQTDKIGKEWVAPLNREARAAIDRVLAQRPGIGTAYLFPSPLAPSNPLSMELANRWLIEAELIAGVPKMDGSLWHAYRRGWATARKGLPVQDLMALGGWTNPACLQTIYQHADWQTMVEAAAQPRRAVGGHNA